jgi:hypothetical protein
MRPPNLSRDAARKSSSEMGTGSQQIAGSNTDLSIRTEQQAAHLEQPTSAMDDDSMSSRKIANITSEIDGIALQTNILALNAAVETARADAQGRGIGMTSSHRFKKYLPGSMTSAQQQNTAVVDEPLRGKWGEQARELVRQVSAFKL